MKSFARIQLGRILILFGVLASPPLYAKNEVTADATNASETKGLFPPETETEKQQKSGLEKKPQQVMTPGEVALQLATQAEAPDVVCIRNSGTLRIAVLDSENPPFFFTNKDGNPEGIDVNIAKQLASALGARVEFVKVASEKDLIDAVIQRKANLGLGRIVVNDENASKVRFTDTYVSMDRGLLINRMVLKKLNRDGGKTLNQILSEPDATLGIQENSRYATYAKEVFPNTKVKAYKNIQDLVNATLNGEVFASYLDELSIRKALDQNPKLGIFLEAVFLKGQSDPIQGLVAWNSNQLAHLINVFLQTHSNFVFDAPKVLEQEKIYQNQINRPQGGPKS